ncbi:DUF4180 domain-containing protein [Streptomyces sp. NBC_00094]|uniref:DUF4180 domain-containing protein n=1 Tax=Streptomyces sp. NBC_00094 TaxID=2903620 RepID=UPI0022577FBC|nr:DUF4180 domain-containing protein [Streptomyces sp. NBC_00094]MCX5389236.1 DUF4180 domain-containing protein [Streptomyces sp. NBC_00094]
MNTVEKIHGIPALLCAAEGASIAAEADILDLIGDAWYQEARWIVVPAERFDASFFQLRTRVAGDIIQKAVNYRLGLAVVGDISVHTEASSPLRDFVRECNRGTQTWFLSDLEEFRERLAG